jgi:hypothetical protein
VGEGVHGYSLVQLEAANKMYIRRHVYGVFVSRTSWDLDAAPFGVPVIYCSTVNGQGKWKKKMRQVLEHSLVQFEETFR